MSSFSLSIRIAAWHVKLMFASQTLTFQRWKASCTVTNQLIAPDVAGMPGASLDDSL